MKRALSYILPIVGVISAISLADLWAVPGSPGACLKYGKVGKRADTLKTWFFDLRHCDQSIAISWGEERLKGDAFGSGRPLHRSLAVFTNRFNPADRPFYRIEWPSVPRHDSILGLLGFGYNGRSWDTMSGQTWSLDLLNARNIDQVLKDASFTSVHKQGSMRSVFIPLWIIIIGIGAPGLRAFHRWHGNWRREAMVREKRCVTCGYDLRATPNRCPECGAHTASESPSMGKL